MDKPVRESNITPAEVSGVETDDRGVKHPFIRFEQLMWSSDWDGDEVGYNDIPVVGLYTWIDLGIDLYIDMESMQILEIWSTEEDSKE